MTLRCSSGLQIRRLLAATSVAAANASQIIAQESRLAESSAQAVPEVGPFTRFVEIPEPSAYASVLALLTVAFACVRSWRNRRISH